MKTTVELPDNLLRQIKLRAVKNGQKLKDAFEELLRKGLAAGVQAREPAGKPVMKTHPVSGLPYFECSPDAPALTMTAAELIALDQQTQTEEDLERLGVSH